MLPTDPYTSTINPPQTPPCLPAPLPPPLLEVEKYAPDEIPKWKRVNVHFPSLYEALLADPDAATRGARLRQAVSASG